jgi:hypothetical protein
MCFVPHRKRVSHPRSRARAELDGALDYKNSDPLN